MEGLPALHAVSIVKAGLTAWMPAGSALDACSEHERQASVQEDRHMCCKGSPFAGPRL